jgi:hypothetical protein
MVKKGLWKKNTFLFTLYLIVTRRDDIIVMMSATYCGYIARLETKSTCSSEDILISSSSYFSYLYLFYFIFFERI